MFPNYSALSPLCTREEFMTAMREMVDENAPRVFALCEELGDRHDAVLHYWGMAHDDHADLIGTGGSLHIGFRDATTARERLACRRNMHLVWPHQPPDPV
ncbi:hypothetical protein SAMN04487904_101687 [Actinopolyspora lacussalsi subsp. righensis]|uniref:Uncharacterized protein n=1 Tax=Actinopolyspora righensis TaxID=995060 RepID=A0A1I6XLF4_9ACTN|nr:hypothetical protein [Actinopolyspora righensis]SFT38664.1 hypothetical protein SAMN04487904_101687 [Actinopolyspora righensis]